MPEANLADVAKSIGDIGESVKTLSENAVTKNDVQPLQTKLNDLEQQIKEIKVGDPNDLKDSVVGLYKSADEFWTDFFQARSTDSSRREAAHGRIFGDKGYISRVNVMLEKSTTGLNSAQDADGAIFLVPQISDTLLTTDVQLAGFESDALSFPVSGPTFEMRALVDKNHSSSVAGGVTVSRKGEGVSPDKSKPAFEKIMWKITKQTGYTDVTEELLADAPAAARLVPSLFALAFRSADESDFLYNGTGAGEPLAALHANNAALVTISKEVGQQADTIVLENILKMRARVIDYGMAYWYATQDVIPQIATITLGDMPIFLPSGTSDVPDRILGRPVKYTEHASALGDINDFALVSPKHYGVANRLGVQSSSSIHVRFLQGETTLRFIKRNDGQPLWKSALTPTKGTTKSPFVNLEAR